MTKFKLAHSFAIAFGVVYSLACSGVTGAAQVSFVDDLRGQCAQLKSTDLETAAILSAKRRMAEKDYQKMRQASDTMKESIQVEYDESRDVSSAALSGVFIVFTLNLAVLRVAKYSVIERIYEWRSRAYQNLMAKWTQVTCPGFH